MTIREKDRRRRQALTRIEKQRARAEAAYKATKSHVWYARMKDLTTKCLALA
jgi:hypothetical protein